MGDVVDDVEGIVAAWQRERPDLDASPLLVLSRVTRLAELMAARRKKIFAEHLLRPYEFDVLAALRRAGEPYELTPGQLIEQTHVTSGTMTNRLDVLVERQLVARRPDSADGRVTRVQLTAGGRSRVDSALTELLAVEANLLTELDAGERTRLAAALQQVLDGTRR
ncbi:MAG: MarR family transcriptional regulator [Pseudonocardiales bacterium]|nr:MarR family transcriptional regulator [Pseudonocardiales bacterium]